jgi:citrate-Mg2+:H+ or citrate-Ca2+:H+ symporter, CitMHS family
MSLTVLAYALIGAFMVLIMTKRLSVLTALVLVPIAFALLGGFGPRIGPMMLDGVRAIAPTGVMLMFAILYFSLMIDAGLFDPAVRRVVKIVGGDPLKICIGTALLALFISLDGDGATTYLICTTALLPLYQKLRMSRLILASIIMQAGGVMNILPWGGPTARAAAALKVDPAQLFVPMIPAMIAGACWVVFVAWLFGRRERARVGVLSPAEMTGVHASALTPQEYELEKTIRRPRLFWFNLGLTVVLMACLVLGVLPLSILFMIAAAIALIVNYPNLEDQKNRIAANAANVFAVVVVIFAAGVFTGILSGTKMIDAMALSVVDSVPPSFGPYLAVITGILSLPFTFFISNDAFYYGVVPVLAEAGAAYGIGPEEIGRASLIGQPVHLLSPLVPSTYLLVGLCGVELGDHQKFTLKWSAITSLVILTIGLLMGVVPWIGAGQ